MSKQHLTSFRVENFKRFDSLELTDIGQCSLIVGDNNVGKPSVLGMISMLSLSTILVFFSCNKEKAAIAEKQVCWHNETGYPLTNSGQIGQQAVNPPNLSSGQTLCEAFGGGSYWSIAFAAQDGTPFAKYAGQVFDRTPDPIEIRIQDSNLTYDWRNSKAGDYFFQRTEINLAGTDTLSTVIDSLPGRLEKADRINELRVYVGIPILGTAAFSQNDYDFKLGSNGFGQLTPSGAFGYQEMTTLSNGNTRKLVIIGKKK